MRRLDGPDSGRIRRGNCYQGKLAPVIGHRGTILVGEDQIIVAWVTVRIGPAGRLEGFECWVTTPCTPVGQLGIGHLVLLRGGHTRRSRWRRRFASSWWRRHRMPSPDASGPLHRRSSRDVDLNSHFLKDRRRQDKLGDEPSDRTRRDRGAGSANWMRFLWPGIPFTRYSPRKGPLSLAPSNCSWPARTPLMLTTGTIADDDHRKLPRPLLQVIRLQRHVGRRTKVSLALICLMPPPETRSIEVEDYAGRFCMRPPISRRSDRQWPGARNVTAAAERLSDRGCRDEDACNAWS